MRTRTALATLMLVALSLADICLAAGPPCAAKLRVGRIGGDGSGDCDFHYVVNGVDCSAKGKCPEQNNQKQDCIVTGGLTYAWTVTQTGGTGSVTSTGAATSRFTVHVVAPVSYTVACTVGGCEACCALNPPTCTGPALPTPPQAAESKTETKTECGGR